MIIKNMIIQNILFSGDASLLVIFLMFDVKLGDLESAQSRFKQVESKAMGDAKSLCNVVINKYVQIVQ